MHRAAAKAVAFGRVHHQLVARWPGWIVAVGWLLPLCLTTATAAPPRFLAQLRSGQRLEGHELQGSLPNNDRRQLDGQELSRAEDPLQWLCDRTLPLAAEPSAYLEFCGGDVLPGRVLQYVAGQYGTATPMGPHFLVETLPVFVAPQSRLLRPAPLQIRVLAGPLRRIVWQAGTHRDYQPQTAICRDGRRFRFRGVRYQPRRLELLTDKGLQQVALEELAEVHLAPQNAWTAYCRELAGLAATPDDWLFQLETADGVTITASRDRCRWGARGSAESIDRWVGAVQPAWSLDTLWIARARIRLERHFPANEIPLTHLDPVRAAYRPLLAGAGPAWLRQRNAEGGPLTAGATIFGWGIGVRATSELEYALPDFPTTFRTHVALDGRVGQGGCVQARIVVDGKPSLETSPLIGGQPPVTTSRLALPAATDASRSLLLQVDSLARRHPKGADPLDIRDLCNWLEPVLSLDSPALAANVARQTELPPAWQGWSAEPRQRQWSSHWTESAGSPGRFLRCLSVSTTPLVLSQRRLLTTQEAWLVIAAGSPDASQPTLLVQIDDQVLSRATIGQLDVQGNAPRVCLPLSAYHDGQPHTLRITQPPAGPNVQLVWQAIWFAPQRP